MIRQFRHAANDFIWEIPAGRLDPGETPSTCAHRELEEETGMRADVLSRLTTIFTTPGFTDERIHIFLAHGFEAGEAPPGKGRVHGGAHQKWSEIMAMVAKRRDQGRQDAGGADVRGVFPTEGELLEAGSLGVRSRGGINHVNS